MRNVPHSSQSKTDEAEAGGEVMINRREFCKKALLVAGGICVPLTALELFDPRRLQAEKDGKGKVRWVFLVDIHKCVGCGLWCIRSDLLDGRERLHGNSHNRCCDAVTLECLYIYPDGIHGNER